MGALVSSDQQAVGLHLLRAFEEAFAKSLSTLCTAAGIRPGTTLATNLKHRAS